jgi:hypothetical protein
MSVQAVPRNFPCPRCGAARGERCTGTVGSHKGRELAGVHSGRTELANAENQRRKAAADLRARPKDPSPALPDALTRAEIYEARGWD